MLVLGLYLGLLLWGLVIASNSKDGFGAMLAVGVVFASAADARFDTPIGLFASDAGERGVLVVVLCSIGFAVVGARAHDLASRAWWWEPRPDPLAGADLEDVAGFGSGPRRPSD